MPKKLQIHLNLLQFLFYFGKKIEQNQIFIFLSSPTRLIFSERIPHPA